MHTYLHSHIFIIDPFPLTDWLWLIESMSMSCENRMTYWIVTRLSKTTALISMISPFAKPPLPIFKSIFSIVCVEPDLMLAVFFGCANNLDSGIRSTAYMTFLQLTWNQGAIWGNVRVSVGSSQHNLNTTEFYKTYASDFMTLNVKCQLHWILNKDFHFLLGVGGVKVDFT